MGTLTQLGKDTFSSTEEYQYWAWFSWMSNIIWISFTIALFSSSSFHHLNYVKIAVPFTEKNSIMKLLLFKENEVNIFNWCWYMPISIIFLFHLIQGIFPFNIFRLFHTVDSFLASFNIFISLKELKLHGHCSLSAMSETIGFYCLWAIIYW